MLMTKSLSDRMESGARKILFSYDWMLLHVKRFAAIVIRLQSRPEPEPTSAAIKVSPFEWRNALHRANTMDSSPSDKESGIPDRKWWKSALSSSVTIGGFGIGGSSILGKTGTETGSCGEKSIHRRPLSQLDKYGTYRPPSLVHAQVSLALDILLNKTDSGGSFRPRFKLFQMTNAIPFASWRG